MPKTPARQGQDWTKADMVKLKLLAKQNTPTPLIAYKMQRSEAAIRGKASTERVSLKPTNKSPDKRRKK